MAPSFFERRPWRTASLFWIGLLLLFFFPVVFRGNILAPLDILDHLMRPWSDGAGGFGVHNAFTYDAISQYLPYDWAVCQSLKKDGFIGWNPWCFGGYALLENTMICPGDWHHQLYRFFDFWTAWDLGIVLQFAIAGFGVLRMLRGEKIPAFAALTGALSYAFYSQHVLWIYHRWVLGASCWFPWIVWAIRRARRQNRLVDFWSVAFTVLSFRGGHLQTCLFTSTLVFCVFLSDWLEQTEKWRARTLLSVIFPYVILAILSSILVGDVLLNTIPPYLAGCKDLPPKSFVRALASLPTLVTSFIPNLCGTPLTLDLFKAVGGDLFNIKYAGAIPMFLALLGIFRRKAPLLPKILFIVGLAIPFTPLIQWFYSRVTVIFALGCAWLAAWTLVHLHETLPDAIWRKTVRIGLVLLGLWLMASMVLTMVQPRLVAVLRGFVEHGLPAPKKARLNWMLARSDSLLDTLPLWHLQNLVPVAIVLVGLVALRRLSKTGRSRWIAIVVVCVFGELFVWSRTWITFAEKPDASETGTLYPVPAWASRLKKELSNGGMLWIHDGKADFDYFQLNAQAGIDIPSLQGYETIRPATLACPIETPSYDPASFAALGVSHVLVRPGVEPPPTLTNWIDRIDTADLHLYRNPAFDSRWHARLADGSVIPLRDNASAPNHHEFDLPAETVSVSLAEPFHRGWTDALGAGPPSHAEKSMTGGTLVSFDSPLAAPGSLIRSFRPRNPLRWPQLALLVLLVLTGGSDNLRPGKRREPVP